MPTVTLSDGRKIKNVPKGMSQLELAVKLKKSGVDIPEKELNQLKQKHGGFTDSALDVTNQLSEGFQSGILGNVINAASAPTPFNPGTQLLNHPAISQTLSRMGVQARETTPGLIGNIAGEIGPALAAPIPKALQPSILGKYLNEPLLGKSALQKMTDVLSNQFTQGGIAETIGQLIGFPPAVSGWIGAGLGLKPTKEGITKAITKGVIPAVNVGLKTVGKGAAVGASLALEQSAFNPSAVKRYILTGDTREDIAKKAQEILRPAVAVGNPLGFSRGGRF